jgi:carbon storage regulator
VFIVARRKGQKIVIGDDIEIVVTELSRTTVKLGISAPKPYSILRGEIRENVAQANREAFEAASSSGDGNSVLDVGQGELDARLSGAAHFLRKSVKTVSPEDVKPETAPG